MKHTLFAIILYTLAVFLPLPARADWERSVTNHTRQTYRAASQNWDIMQQGNGWMYFANNKGLLEFDGSHWAVYSMNGVKPKAIAAGEDGRIYAGGLKEFGYFEPDGLGRLQYTSLSDSLDRVKNVWSVHVCGGKVFFREDNAVYCHEDGVTRVWDDVALVYSTLIDGRLYGASGGLFRQEGDKLELLPHTAGFVGGTLERRVVGMFPYGGKALLVVTAQDGLFLYEDGEWTPLPMPDSRLLRGVQLSCSAKAGHLLALGSVQDGVFLLDLAQGTVEHVSTHNGLQNKGVLSLCFDRDGNLWAGLNSGIDCVLFRSSMPFRCTDIGSGYASCFHRGKLYLGTNQGLFVNHWPSPRMEQTPWTAGQVYSLSIHRGDLFCAGSRALGVIGPDGRMQVIQGLPGIWHVAEIKGCDRLIAATYVGFYLLEKTAGRWEVIGKVKGTPYSAKSFCVEPATGALWVANKEDGIHRLRLSARGDSILHEKCYNSSALPKGNNVCIAVVDGKIVVASHQGLFRYDAKGDTLARDGLLEKAADGAAAYTYLRQDALRNIWYVTNGVLKVLYYNALQDEYLLREGETYLADTFVEDFEHIDVYAPDEGKALVGLEDGFALLRTNHHAGRDTSPLTLQVRNVYASGSSDSLVYGSSYLPVPEQPLRIPYGLNSLFILSACVTLLSLCITFIFVKPTPKITYTYPDHKQNADIEKNIKISIFAINCSGFVEKLLMVLTFALAPIILNEHIEKTYFWIVYVPAIVVGVLALGPTSILSEKRGKAKEVLLVSILIFCIAYLCMALWIDNVAIFGIALALFFAAFSMQEALLQGLISKYARAKNRGAVIGDFSAAGFGGSFIGAIIGGNFSTYESIMTWHWILFITLMICMVIWFLFVFITIKNPNATKTLYIPSHDIMDNLESLNTLIGVIEWYKNTQENVVTIKYNAKILDSTQIYAYLGIQQNHKEG